jgi:hypothetical protein
MSRGGVGGAGGRGGGRQKGRNGGRGGRGENIKRGLKPKDGDCQGCNQVYLMIRKVEG